MKILMVTDFYAPVLGGLERSVEDLSTELRNRGHQVEVATLALPGVPQRDEIAGIPIHRLESLLQRIPGAISHADRPFHPPAPDPAVIAALRRVVTAVSPDVIHGHTWMVLSHLVLKRKGGPPVVVTLHDYSLICPKKNLLWRDGSVCSHHLSRHCLPCAPGQYGWPRGTGVTVGLSCARRLYQRVDAAIAISPWVASAHGTVAEIRGKTITIPNFVRDELLTRPIGPPLSGLPHDYALYVGSLGAHKGLEVLRRVYLHGADLPPLVIVGMGKEADLPDLPSNVTTRTNLSHADTLRAIDHAAMLVVPSLWPEPFGLVIVEAMARGKAVIASAVGGIANIVQDGRTGLLVPPGDGTALRHALTRLRNDRALARDMGCRGRERCITAYAASAVVPRIEEIYRGVVAAHQMQGTRERGA